jgi:hypothetical protein
MEWLDFLVLTLASSGMLELWFKGSIFAGVRSLAETKDEDFWNPPEPPGPTSPEAAFVAEHDDTLEETPLSWPLRLYDRLPNWVGALMICRLCFSYHAPFWLGLTLWAPSLWLPEPWGSLLKFPLYALAASRAGNILTGVLPAALQYKEDPDDKPVSPADSSIADS